MAKFLKIKSLAQERGMTLKELAEQVGMTAPGLSQIISQNRGLTTTIENIAKVLNVPVGYFFDDDYVQQQDASIYLEIIKQKDEDIKLRDERIRELTDMLIKTQSRQNI